MYGSGPTHFRNHHAAQFPYVRDIITQRRLLEDIGATVLTPELRTHKITASHIELFEAPYELVKTMRASVLALGPLLARFGKQKFHFQAAAQSERDRLIYTLRGLNSLAPK